MSESKKVVLITGAAGGIGRATVQYFAAHGWRVIGVDRHPFGEEYPQDGLFIQADIANPADFETIFDKTEKFTS